MSSDTHNLREIPVLTRFEQLKVTGDLPSPKGAALAIIRLTQKEKTSLVELSHAIKTDPAFTGRIIKAANAIRPAERRPVVAIQDALSLLGIPAVRSLALGFSLLSGYRSGNCRNFDYARYWSHSLVCAVALQAITLRTRAAPADEAFSLGLLAQIGKLALATLFPEDYSRLLEHTGNETTARLIELEQERFAIDRFELSAAMLIEWGFPKIYADMALHYNTRESDDTDGNSRSIVLQRSLALADCIADICLSDDSMRCRTMPKLLAMGKKLAFDAEPLTTLCDKVAAEWREWSSLLDIAAATVPSFQEMSQLSTTVALMEAPIIGHTDEASRLRILVADDDDAMRTLIGTLLSRSGHEVFTAVDGAQAFDMVLDLRPHIMVVDWMMPEMDGIELTRALRQTQIGRGIYILIVTGAEDEERLIEAFESGVDDFMSKPFNARVLGARLRAGQRVVRMQQEIQRDREEIHRFAAELAITNRRLQEVSITDSLTGFPNRRYAIDRFEQEWAAAERNRRPLACMVIDIDAFKTINDTHGHDVGDAVLKQIAHALKSGLRAHDVVCRLGGDEFLAICPDTALNAALACAERMRRAVEAHPIATENLQLRGSISVGVAMRDESMKNFNALIKMADKSVYVAKQRGRNCVVALQK
ncbi:MAG TPA: diguanylate cyclase [Rhodocyclaceae bacterium]|nr:diguanylate cyclase [Rhodocyclaceae bacterium]